MGSYLSINTDNSQSGRLLNRLLAEFVRFDWYQNLASSVSRILVIYPGERHEEIVKNIGDILKIGVLKIELFYNYIVASEPIMVEGKFFPGRYVVSKDASQKMSLIYLLQNLMKKYCHVTPMKLSFRYH